MAKHATEPRTPLSRDRAITVAVRLADEGGIDSLTMRKLAKELQVEAMSLYYHVPNKDDILDGMVDFVFSQIVLPSADTPWKKGMRDRAHSARNVLNLHPWAVSLMDSRTSPGPETLAHHNAVLGCLREGGFSVVMAAHAFSLLDAYIFGFVLQDTNLPFESPEELQALADSIMESFPAEAFPHMYELTIEHVLKPGYNYGDEFQYGLELILDGLEVRLSTAKP
jgi:AcrR family transcriptional regulator